MRYGPGGYFGEMALLMCSARRASVLARGPCVAASIDKATFNTSVGSLHHILASRASASYATTPPRVATQVRGYILRAETSQARRE
eukprot:7192264-Pyramimonas_sp.AAC.1